MKSAGLLATFTFLCGQIASGQQNGVFSNQNAETNSFVSPQPSQTMTNIVQRYLNQNGKSALTNNINPRQGNAELNSATTSTNLQKLQQPSDSKPTSQLQALLQQQQKLPAQQFSQLQKSSQLQQTLPAQQPLQTQQSLGLQQNSLQQMPNFQDNTDLIQTPVVQQQMPVVQHQTSIVQQQAPFVQQQTPIVQQQAQIAQQTPVVQHQSPIVQQQAPIVHQQTPIMQQQMPIVQQQIPISQQQTPIVQQQMSILQQQTPNVQQQMPIVQQQTNYQPPSAQIHLKLQPTNPPGVNIVQPLTTQNILQHNPNLRSAEVFIPQQNTPIKNQDIPVVRYHISSQQPSPLSPSSPSVVSNPSIALLPSYNIKPVEPTYISPYNYVQPVPEIQAAGIDRTNPMQALPSIITLPSPILQNTQTPTQAFYYGQPSDTRQSVYVNQNPYSYPHQSQTSVTAQAQPTAVLSSQPSVISPLPVSIVQAPQVSPQYTLSSTYPVNTITSPTYTTQKSKSLNLKAFLPLIFNLLREKIATCQNGCPCNCEKKNVNNPEVFSGYSSQKLYGALKEDGPSILNSVPESEGCLRKRKNCVKNETITEINDVRDVSEESREDEDSDEEEVSEDEED